MKFLNTILLTVLLISQYIFAETRFVIEGNVVDKSTGKNIPGAGIRISGTNKGTYSSSRGFYRLNIQLGDTLLIRSLGYFPDTLIISEKISKMDFKLTANPVITDNVDVTAAITPEQIIERVVKKRNENKEKLKTFSGELYSKLVMELGGKLLSAGSDDDGSFSISSAFGRGEEPSDSKKYMIMETYSTVQKDYPQKINRTTINKRRQTANIPADQNIMAISEFVDFYDDEITFLKTTIPSPIGEYALASYNFKIKDRVLNDGRYIYILDVEPKTKLYPRFQGEIKVIEGTYNVIELDLKPSSTTAIPLFENLAIIQKYNESGEKIWYPAFLDVSANVKIDIIKGLFDFKTDLKVTSIFNDAEINKPLPDSVYEKTPTRITVSKLADTKDSVFWQQNSLMDLSPREIEIYAKVDSSYKKDSVTVTQKSKSLSVKLFEPYFDFNRVGSVSIGVIPEISYKGYSLSSESYFSFGLQDILENFKFELPNYRAGKYNIKLIGKAYSKLGTFGYSLGQYPMLYNTAAGLFVHEDYNDYFRERGFGVNLNISRSNFKFDIAADFANHEPLKKNTDKSIFESYAWRQNPEAQEGDYQTLRTKISYGNINPLMLSNNIDIDLKVEALGGIESNSKTEFGGINGRMILSVPTFNTGYGPMHLLLSFDGGITTYNTPVQFQNRMSTRLFILNNTGNFFTAPLGFYGGDRFYSVQALYNLSDIWWRWLGLPTYEGRGLDLTIGGTYGKFENNTNSFYSSTGKDGYAEAGFGFSRIPTFFSNIVFWSFDLRFGIGEEAAGKTRGAVSISLPF